MDNKQSIAEKLLQKIEHATPRSRLYFILRNVGMWLLALLSVGIGGLAVSSLIFRFVNVPAAFQPGMPPVSEILLAIPFLWILLLAAFLYLAYKEIRLTQKGYKYELGVLILGTLLASSVLGIVFYVTGTGFILDRFAAHHIPLHTDLEKIQRDRWLQPEEGFLVGVMSTSTETGIVLLDPLETPWRIEFASSIPEMKIKNISEGERFGVRGKILNAEEHVFLACDIRSLEFEGRGLIPPRHLLMQQSERKVPGERSNECEDVRPLDY